MAITPDQVQALRPLLDLIYSGEGGYESVNRGRAGDTPGGWPGLTKLTLGDVMEAQAQGRVNAVGAPQFIAGTLKQVATEAKADRKAPFDASMQDLLAAWLVLGRKRPKLARYLRGEVSGGAALRDAIDELAYEWASLPLHTGKGAYDGDRAGNKAHGKVEAVEKALLAARSNLAALKAKPSVPSAGSPKQPAAAADEPKVLYRITAVQDTWLKKSAEPASLLPDSEKVLCKKGQTWDVVARVELPRDAHAVVTLSHGAGTWHVFEPHWSRPGTTGPAPAAAIDWSDFSCQITEFLTVGEVLQWDHRRRPASNSADIRRILSLAQQHRAIRIAAGVPIGVTSWYRPEPINRQVGGVVGSYHISGRAMDVYPVGRPLDWLYQLMRQRWTGGLGDGRHRGFIHLDDQGSGRFVPGGGVGPARVWTY